MIKDWRFLKDYMLIIGTNLFKVLPDELMENEESCSPKEFAEELQRILKSWDLEERSLFHECVKEGIISVTEESEYLEGFQEMKEDMPEYADNIQAIIDILF